MSTEAAEHTDTETVLGTSTVRVVSAPGRAKLVELPLGAEPVAMGVRDEVAAHYRLDPSDYEPTTTTLDYLVGAVVACLTGTFGGRLAPLGQETSGGALVADGVGELVVNRGVLRIRAIDVTYHLRLSEGVDVAKVHRAHDTHAKFCPVAASVGAAITLSTHLQLL